MGATKNGGRVAPTALRQLNIRLRLKSKFLAADQAAVFDL